MVSPLVGEWIHAIFFMLLGILAFFVGRRVSGLPTGLRRGVLVFVMAVQMIAIASYFGLLPASVRYAFDSAGGVMEIAGCAAVLIFGSAHKKLSKIVLALAVFSLLAVVFVFASIPLYWHYFDEGAQSNYPNVEGLILQRTEMTCAPAAGAMLLHLYGFRASEGRVAELAKTDFRGTDQYMLTEALNSVLKGSDLKAQTSRMDIEQAEELKLPFVAFIKLPDRGLHAVLVNSIQSDVLFISDPMYGIKTLIPREEFVKMWKHNAVWIEMTDQ